MRRVRIAAESRAPDLERALAEGPAELLLEAAPRALPREELLLLVSRAKGPLVALFLGDLASPLAEAALLCLHARYPLGAALDLSHALLTPLILRHGTRGARLLLARHGARVPAAEALGPPAGDLSSLSPLALRLARELLVPPRRGALARERAAFGLVMTAPDRSEGIRAFRERRRPHFEW